jgi:hypothetical protein
MAVPNNDPNTPNSFLQPSPMPQQPAQWIPRFRNAAEVWSNHILIPGWKPLTGTHGIPMNADGEVDEPRLIPYVRELFNAFKDVSNQYDGDEHAELLQRYRAGSTWTDEDIEAVSHVLVNTAVHLHTTGAVSMVSKRVPGRAPAPNRPDAQITFAQRLFLLATLIRHYKFHAEKMMWFTLHEDQLIGIYTTLHKTSFPQRLSANPQENQAWSAQLASLGMQGQHLVGTPGAQGQHGPNAGVRFGNRM